MKLYLLGGKAAQYQSSLRERPLDEAAIKYARSGLVEAIESCPRGVERDMAEAVLRETDEVLVGIREFMASERGREYWRKRLKAKMEAL